MAKYIDIEPLIKEGYHIERMGSWQGDIDILDWNDIPVINTIPENSGKIKCPYRTVIKTDNNITTTEFADCYENKCPWYIPKSIMCDDVPVSATCQKCHMENTKVMNEYDSRR